MGCVEYDLHGVYEDSWVWQHQLTSRGSPPRFSPIRMLAPDGGERRMLHYGGNESYLNP